MVEEAAREEMAVAEDEQQQAVVVKVVRMCVAADELPRRSPCLFASRACTARRRRSI